MRHQEHSKCLSHEAPGHSPIGRSAQNPKLALIYFTDFGLPVVDLLYGGPVTLKKFPTPIFLEAVPDVVA